MNNGGLGWAQRLVGLGGGGGKDPCVFISSTASPQSALVPDQSERSDLWSGRPRAEPRFWMNAPELADIRKHPAGQSRARRPAVGSEVGWRRGRHPSLSAAGPQAASFVEKWYGSKSAEKARVPLGEAAERHVVKCWAPCGIRQQLRPADTTKTTTCKGVSLGLFISLHVKFRTDYEVPLPPYKALSGLAP